MGPLDLAQAQPFSRKNTMASLTSARALPEHEHLENIRQRAVTWIAAADQKATAMLGIAGALAALGGPAFAASGGKGSLLARLFLCAFAALDLFAVLSAVIVLWPRTDRPRILRRKGLTSVLPRSISFFADLAALDATQFAKHLTDATPDLRHQDTYEQAIVICEIAALKMQWMRWTIGFLGASLVMLVLSLLAAAAT